ncbi:MAG TPA: tetratricopeptide repeat protein [Steroidobacteraceae bacterium]|nr:tetratricopeptide repeat protein [Steroidobacteraceae bacterium]
MFKRIAASTVLVLALSAGPVLAADPTIDQVYQAAQSGHLDQAQQMMNQVLRDHPNSAKAHYVEAEVAARAGNRTRAREELATAQRIDPSGSFANAGSLAALQRELARTSSSGGYIRAVPQEHRSSVPWGLILLVVAGVVIAWALLARRNPPQYGGYTQYPGGVPPVGPGGGYGGPAGYGPGGYGPPMGGGMGSGIVGGLASGLAIGAGVAAGEELVRHMIDRDGNRVPVPPDYVPPADDNPNMGGNDFGVTGGGSWDDSGGGSSWGGDSGGGGGDDWT